MYAARPPFGYGRPHVEHSLSVQASPRTMDVISVAPFPILHSPQEVTRFWSSLSAPPRDRGITWSTCNFTPSSWADRPQYRQRKLSRSRMRNRTWWNMVGFPVVTSVTSATPVTARLAGRKMISAFWMALRRLFDSLASPSRCPHPRAEHTFHFALHVLRLHFGHFRAAMSLA